MIKKGFSLLETGSKTKEEFVKAFYDKKPLNYTTSNIRKEYCDKCNDIFSTCNNCFIYECLEEIYKNDPFA